MKQLRLWNGRWSVGLHCYVAAYSVADALRLVEQCLGYLPRGMRGEIENYWSPGLWGRTMDGITPERGIWVVREDPPRKALRRLIPHR